MIPLGWTIVYDSFGMNYCIWFLWDELLYMIPLGVSVSLHFNMTWSTTMFLFCSSDVFQVSSLAKTTSTLFLNP